jgi:aspartyl protease family protein
MPPAAYFPSLIVHAVCQAKRRVVLRMLVDTGATYTMIPRQAALAVGLNPSDAARRIPVITASTVEYVPLLHIPVWRCLGLTVQDFELACHDLPPESAVDGLLGLNFLRHFSPFQRFHQDLRSFLVSG